MRNNRLKVRPQVLEPFKALEKFGSLWERQKLAELVPLHMRREFELKFATWYAQAQTQSYRRLMNWKYTHRLALRWRSPLRDIIQYRGEEGDPGYGTLQVLQAFKDVMNPACEEDLMEIQGQRTFASLAG